MLIIKEQEADRTLVQRVEASLGDLSAGLVRAGQRGDGLPDAAALTTQLSARGRELQAKVGARCLIIPDCLFNAKVLFYQFEFHSIPLYH